MSAWQMAGGSHQRGSGRPRGRVRGDADQGCCCDCLCSHCSQAVIAPLARRINVSCKVLVVGLMEETPGWHARAALQTPTMSAWKACTWGMKSDRERGTKDRRPARPKGFGWPSNRKARRLSARSQKNRTRKTKNPAGQTMRDLQISDDTPPQTIYRSRYRRGPGYGCGQSTEGRRARGSAPSAIV